MPEESPYDLAPESPPPVPAEPAPPAVVDHDVPCRECSFNLRGLAEDGRCPECGAMVWRSLQGNLLVYAGVEYLAALRRGLMCIIVATIVQLVLSITVAGAAVAVLAAVAGRGGSFVNQGLVQAIGAFITLPLTAVLLYGWWLFSAPDPGRTADQEEETARRVVRAATITLVVTTIANAVAQSFVLISPQQVDVLAGGVNMIAGIATIVQFFASLLYVRRLAPRLPSPEIAERSRKYMWLLPLIFILGACVIIGPLVAQIMYLVLLNDVRRHVDRARAEQERLPA